MTTASLLPDAFDVARPPSDDLYRALVERDASYEGVFIVGVRTTGIFCRPTCPARKPKRENVEFFPTAREAIAAGYRACKRCLPLEPGPAPSNDLVRTLMQRVQATPLARIRDADLAREGLDPSTVRRQFKAAIGMTFQQYQRAERLGRAFAALKASSTGAAWAAGAAGYDSVSGFTEAFASLFGVTPGRAHESARLWATWFETPLGPMVSIAHDEGVVLLEFTDRRALEREVHDLRARFDSPIVPGRHSHHEQLGVELDAYFAGESFTFTTPLHLVGSDFQRAVWRELQTIPPGETRTYGAQAAAIGRPGAARAVGRANGENRIAIVIPCHRVIGADGSLVGYAGGVWRKRWLLGHERRSGASV